MVPSHRRSQHSRRTIGSIEGSGLVSLGVNNLTVGSNAKGVTINSGAQFAFADLNTGTLTAGTVFTVINNTSAAAIAGTFTNLANGSTFTSTGGTTFQASYTGGTGNDLTLTVVPEQLAGHGDPGHAERRLIAGVAAAGYKRSITSTSRIRDWMNSLRGNCMFRSGFEMIASMAVDCQGTRLDRLF